MDKLTIRFLGLLAALLCGVAVYAFPEAFLTAYFVSFMYFLSLSLGALGFILIHSLTGGEWGFRLRPILERMAGQIKPLSVFALPVLAWLWLYEPWEPQHHHFSVHARSVVLYYLNKPFLTVRLVLYFAFWVWLFSAYKARTPADGYAPQGFSGAGLFFLILTISFAAIDWIMSLTPGWHSTIFGLIMAVGSASASFALAAIIYHSANLDELRVRWDHAKILLTTVILITYLSYSQYLITWTGNLKEDVVWYLPRTVHNWSWVALTLLICYSLFPFLIFLFGGKTRAFFLGAFLITAFYYVHLTWLIWPALEHGYSSEDFVSQVLSLSFLGILWLTAIRRHPERATNGA